MSKLTEIAAADLVGWKQQGNYCWTSPGVSWCGEGASIVLPLYMGAGCQINANVRIGANVHIGSNSRIDQGCRVSSGCRIGEDCHIGVGCRIGKGSDIESYCCIGSRSTVSELCWIGENCHIGPDCHIGSGCHIGACSYIGPHSRLGDDCHLGGDCRIGAGAQNPIDLGYCDGYRRALAEVDGVAFIGSGCRWWPLDRIAAHWRAHGEDRSLSLCLLPALYAIAEKRGLRTF